MKALRIPRSILALATLSMLAACGGGGGGGSVTPPGGGGGGGGGATPTPTTAPTNSPTNAPTNSPTPSPTPSGVTVQSGWQITAAEDIVNGDQSWYTSGTASWSNNAGDTSSSAATGSNTVDGLTCADTVEGTSYPSTEYSQHAFVGFINSSGLEKALPQALGMIVPVAPMSGTPSHPSNTYPVENYQCEYSVHTHDYSGLVHMENQSLSQTSSYTYAMPGATLQSLLDLWGATLTSSGLTAGASSLSGAVTIYVGTPSGKTSGGADLVTSYSVYTGLPNALNLTRHEAIWIVIGTTAANIPPFAPGNTNGLPIVKFAITN